MSADGTIYLRVCRYTQISPLSSQRRERLFRSCPLRLSEGAFVSFPSSSAAESIGSDEGTPCLLGGERLGRHSFGYFSFAAERKVTRPWVQEPTTSQAQFSEEVRMCKKATGRNKNYQLRKTLKKTEKEKITTVLEKLNIK